MYLQRFSICLALYCEAVCDWLQVIDDVQGHTIASASTQSKNVRESLGEDSAATVVCTRALGACLNTVFCLHSCRQSETTQMLVACGHA